MTLSCKNKRIYKSEFVAKIYNSFSFNYQIKSNFQVQQKVKNLQIDYSLTYSLISLLPPQQLCSYTTQISTPNPSPKDLTPSLSLQFRQDLLSFKTPLIFIPPLLWPSYSPKAKNIIFLSTTEDLKLLTKTLFRQIVDNR